MSSSSEEAHSHEELSKAMPPKIQSLSSFVSGAVPKRYCTVIMRDGVLSAIQRPVSIITHDEPVFNRFFQYLQKFF